MKIENFRELNIFNKKNGTHRSFLVPLTVEFSASADDSADDDGIWSAFKISANGMAYMLELKVKTIATMMAQHNFTSIFLLLFIIRAQFFFSILNPFFFLLSQTTIFYSNLKFSSL